MVIITKYNSKQYFINDIDFNQNPVSFSFNTAKVQPGEKPSEDTQVRMVDYMANKYNVTISQEKLKQPLLVVNRKSGDVYLASSLCYCSSLGKDFTKDARKMKDLQESKMNNPIDRYNRISRMFGLIN